MGEKGLKGVYEVLGKVQDVGKRSQRITVNVIQEVKKARPAGAARESVHGVVPKSG